MMNNRKERTCVERVMRLVFGLDSVKLVRVRGVFTRKVSILKDTNTTKRISFYSLYSYYRLIANTYSLLGYFFKNMPEINNSNIYSNRTALQIISHMWSLPNTDPPLWESYGLRQCLLGSLQLFDRPEEQLALLEERLSTGDTMNDYKFGREDVLRFMRSISNLQKRNQAYPALSGETSEGIAPSIL